MEKEAREHLKKLIEMIKDPEGVLMYEGKVYKKYPSIKFLRERAPSVGMRKIGDKTTYNGTLVARTKVGRNVRQLRRIYDREIVIRLVFFVDDENVLIGEVTDDQSDWPGVLDQFIEKIEENAWFADRKGRAVRIEPVMTGETFAAILASGEERRAQIQVRATGGTYREKVVPGIPESVTLQIAVGS